MSESIHFFNENIRYVLEEKRRLRSWIRDTAAKNKVDTGEINFIFCDDQYLTEINIKYLNHNTLTDIITFNYGDSEGVLQGDIYISMTRVKDNASEYGVSIKNELHRVMIHGILHLMGYNDKTVVEKREMRRLEDECLNEYSKIFS
ncbi:MAG: rRNA maturation RNase YbeY [Bacteroidota bacterium]